MDLCKICNKSLYEKISFVNIFRSNQSVHDKCIENLSFNNDTVSIPIMNNLIHYDYLFDYILEDNNSLYLEQKYMSRILERNLDTNEWSILIYYEKGLFKSFSDDDFLILFSLSNNPFLVISLTFFDLSNIITINL
jgi:hypothetical protein